MSTAYAPPPPRATPPVDPRNIITEDAYRLDPALLGTPLARPWRRGAAMAVDGLCIALLSNAPGVLLAFAAAFVLFRVSGRGRDGAPRTGMRRAVLRFWAASILFVAVIVGSGSVSDWFENLLEDGVEVALGDDEGGTTVAASSAVTPGQIDLSGREGLRAAAEFARFTAADDEAEARERLQEILPMLRRAGMSDAEVGEMLRGVASSQPEKPWLAAAVESMLPTLAAAQPAPADAPAPDSLVLAYAAALADGDSARAAELRPLAATALAADSLAALRAELDDQRDDQLRLARDLAAAREEAESSGILATLRSIADDVGLGFGWAGLYFTAFLALWSGLTPGKRLLGVRVIRLDGRPIGWWSAFERFGGYAAGVATGLLGFAQIYWDRNRQAVHDKISETVVIRVGA